MGLDSGKKMIESLTEEFTWINESFKEEYFPEHVQPLTEDEEFRNVGANTCCVCDLDFEIEKKDIKITYKDKKG